jgi:SNF2 family DNA or RNA helicase
MSDFDLFSHYHGGDSAGGSKEAGDVMARMLAVEMLLNHPDLIRQSAAEYEDGARRRKEGEERANWSGSKYAAMLMRRGALDEVKSSPKMDHLISRLQDITEGNPASKVIVFSFHRRACGIIEQRLAEVGIGSVSYHGEMTASQKVGAVAKFRDEPQTRVIICSHAAAFGTDLKMADYLINFDLPWSAGTADQINARHVRASSEFERVFIVNLICENTIEARKPEVLAHKRKTATAIVDGHGADGRGRLENQVATLTEYLKSTL